MSKVLRVLVVDDSAFVRKIIKQILSRSPFIEVVGISHDGEEALEMVEELNPDIVTLDLIMPRMGGLEFIQKQMQKRRLPILIVSVADECGELVLAALEAGAVDFVHKPTALATEKLLEIGDELIEKVKAVTHVPLPPPPPAVLPPPPIARRSGLIDIIVLGISTGGPQALNFLIPQLPADFPIPVAMVLHMPVGFTELFAQRLNDRSILKVIEAKEEDIVCPGVVLLAPAGKHMTFRRQANGKIVAHIDPSPTDTLHRPAVDVLFESAAEVFGDRVLGIVMTGMGADGKQGAAWIKSHGGTIFTEAEETCVVYGMPRSVVEAGLSDRSVPLTQMAQAILDAI